MADMKVYMVANTVANIVDNMVVDMEVEKVADMEMEQGGCHHHQGSRHHHQAFFVSQRAATDRRGPAGDSELYKSAPS